MFFFVINYKLVCIIFNVIVDTKVLDWERMFLHFFFTVSVILLDFKIYIKKKEHLREEVFKDELTNNLKVEVIWLEIKVLIAICTNF